MGSAKMVSGYIELAYPGLTQARIPPSSRLLTATTHDNLTHKKLLLKS